jgi:hypothetical protein
MAVEIVRLLGVPIDDDKDSVMGLRMALLAAQREAHDEVYQSIRP